MLLYMSFGPSFVLTLERMPVEDASVERPEEDMKNRLWRLGHITIPPQITNSPERMAYADNVLSFTPWRCLAAHRPLGSIMRVRKAAYEASSAFRHEQNNSLNVELRTISELPDN